MRVHSESAIPPSPNSDAGKLTDMPAEVFLTPENDKSERVVIPGAPVKKAKIISVVVHNAEVISVSVISATTNGSPKKKVVEVTMGSSEEKAEEVTTGGSSKEKAEEVTTKGSPAKKAEEVFIMGSSDAKNEETTGGSSEKKAASDDGRSPLVTPINESDPDASLSPERRHQTDDDEADECCPTQPVPDDEDCSQREATEEPCTQKSVD